MILSVNGDEWDVWVDTSPLWDYGYSEDDLNKLRREVQILKDSFDFSQSDEEGKSWDERRNSKNYVIVSDELLIIGYFIVSNESGDVIKKVMLTPEQIIQTYEDEVIAFQKRKTLVNSFIDKFSK